jgi:hypothetical protein
VRTPRRANDGRTENRDAASAMGYSRTTSSIACFHMISVRGGSGGPVVCDSALSYETNDRSDGSDRRVATMRGAGSSASFS